MMASSKLNEFRSFITMGTFNKQVVLERDAVEVCSETF
jgi:hypothetical protein